MPRPGHVAPNAPRGAVRLELDETLDFGAAERAMEILEGAPPGARLILDFSGVRSIDYAALAALVSALAEGDRARLMLRGLCTQHWRVLRYLGLDASCRESRDAVDERDPVNAAALDPIA